MSELIMFEEVEKRVLTIQGQQVLLDRDVAELYGVETKHINQALRNNPDKFPDGYVITLGWDDLDSSRSKISTLNDSVSGHQSDSSRSKILTLNGSGRGHNIKYLPKAFTEKGLYMLATILKSPIATQTTLAIVETFAKMREFAKILTQLPDVEDSVQQKSLVQRGSEIFTEVLDDCIFEATDDEISYEIDLGAVKAKRIIKRKKKT